MTLDEQMAQHTAAMFDRLEHRHRGNGIYSTEAHQLESRCEDCNKRIIMDSKGNWSEEANDAAGV